MDDCVTPLIIDNRYCEIPAFCKSSSTLSATAFDKVIPILQNTSFLRSISINILEKYLLRKYEVFELYAHNNVVIGRGKEYSVAVFKGEIPFPSVLHKKRGAVA